MDDRNQSLIKTDPVGFSKAIRLHLPIAEECSIIRMKIHQN